jgi:uncharacterized membrane protein YdjX (TVP38/TMEM64 family)
VLLVGLLLWLGHRADLGRHASLDGMRALVAAWGPYGPLAFIGVCIAGIFLHMPEILLIAVGGLLFEGAHAFAYGWIAAVLGATSTFLVVRYFARDHFQRAVSGRFARLRALDERLERHGFVTVLVLRLVLFMAPPLNWALGASRVRLAHYVGGTALGVVPGVAAAVFFAESIAQREPGDGAVNGRMVLGILLVAAVLVLGAVAGRRLLNRVARPPAV